MLGRSDAVLAKITRNLAQHQIRKKEIPNLEITQVLNFIADGRIVSIGGGGVVNLDWSI